MDDLVGPVIARDPKNGILAFDFAFRPLTQGMNACSLRVSKRGTVRPYLVYGRLSGLRMSAKELRQVTESFSQNENAFVVKR